MKSIQKKLKALKGSWRVVAAMMFFCFVVWFGFASSAAQTSKARRILSVRVNNSLEGSRVTVFADLTMDDYEAYRRGERFFVTIPASEFASGQPHLRGNGFDDIQVERTGESVVISFRLQPGATARVDQHSNQLDVVFSAVPRASLNDAARAQNSGQGYSQNRERRTVDTIGPTPPNSPDNALNNSRATERFNSFRSAFDGYKTQVLNSEPATISKSSTPPQPGALTSPVSSGTTVGVAPTSLEPTMPMVQAESTKTSDPGNKTTAQSESPATLPILMSVRQWLTTHSSLALAALAVLVLGIPILLLVRNRRRKNTHWKGEKVGPKAIESVSPGWALMAEANPAEPEVMSHETAVNSLPSKAEALPDEVSLNECENPPPAVEVKELILEPLFPNTPEHFERTNSEVEKLLAGDEYDAALIGAGDSATRQVVAASLLGALASRDPVKEEHAKRAFVDHGYFDETTRDLRTAGSPAERAAAARKLGEVGDSLATIHLIASLYDTAPEVRRASVDSLGQIGDGAAMSPLNDLVARETSGLLPEAVVRQAINAIAVTQLKRASTAEKHVLRVMTPESSTDETARPPDLVGFSQPTPMPVSTTAAEPPPAHVPSSPLADQFESEGLVSDEEAKLHLEEQALRRAAEDVERRRLEAEIARRQAEEDARLKAEREVQLRNEIELLLKAEEEARRRAEEEALRRRIEKESRIRLEQETRVKAEEQLRIKAQEEARLKADEEAQFRLEAETLRRAAEELARKRAEAGAARKQAEEEARRRVEEEARRRVEEEARRRADEEIARHRAEEAYRLIEERVRRRAEEEAQRQAQEEARIRAEEENRVRLEQEAKRLAEDELRRQVEVEMRLRAEAEVRRIVEEVERRRVEEETRRIEEENRKREEEEEKRLEVEANRIAEQDMLRRAQAESLLKAAEDRRRIEEQKFMLEQQALLKAADEVARRRREVEAARLKAEEEARLLQAAQEQIRIEERERRQAEEERQRLEAEARSRAEEERRRFEEARRRAVEEQKRLEEETRRKAEEEARLLEEARERIRADAELRQQSEQERQRLEDEAKRLAEEVRRQLEEIRLRTAEEKQRLDEARQKAEEEARLLREAQERIRAEDEARAKAEQERQRLEGEARARAEEELKRLEEAHIRAAEEQKQLEAEIRVRAEEEERRLAELEAERTRVEEQSRLRAEQEQSIRAEIEALYRAEEDQRQRLEAETRRRSEAEARLRDEKARRQAEEEARIEAEREVYLAEDARMRFAEDARRRAEAETQIQAEQEARRLADEEARSREEEDRRLQAEREARLRAEEDAGLLEAQRRQEQGMVGREQSVQGPNENSWEKVSDDLDLLPTSVADNAIVLDHVEPESLVKGIDVIQSEKGIATVPDGSDLSPALLERLNSSSTVERAAALNDLARLGNEDAFRFISGAFDDQSPDVRNAAARALYNFQADRAASFTRALREGTPERRRKIGSALAASGLASDAITNLTGESREKTYDAFSLLFLMAKAGEVHPLMRAIEDYPNIEVRLAVVKLLALSGQPEIVPAFRRLAVRGSLPSEVRSAVMEAIYQISSQTRESAPSAA